MRKQIGIDGERLKALRTEADYDPVLVDSDRKAARSINGARALIKAVDALP